MEESAGVEFDREVNQFGSVYRIHSPSTHRVMRMPLHIHDAMEVLILNIQLYVDTICQTVDKYFWSREGLDWGRCCGNWN